MESTEPYALEAIDVSKSFGAAPALNAARLAVAKGSIHALLGENGAGKSTLIKAITGAQAADSGVIKLYGEPAEFRSPHDALRAGISAVYQERNLVPAFSVAENIFLGAAPTRGGLVDFSRMYQDAGPWLERVGLSVDPERPAGSLSVAQGQLLEVARALALRSKVLLLDEPTASITDREAGLLFDTLRELRSGGAAVLFVSHKLEEVFALCDTITVLRDGETVLEQVPASQLTQQDVITAMVGRQVDLSARDAGARQAEPSAPVLELRGVSSSYGHEGIDLELRPGRITGMYGLIGAGRSELARTILGLGKMTAGTLIVHGQEVRIGSPSDAIHRYRIGYVSEDRKGEGLILAHSVSKNLGITMWDMIKGVLGYVNESRQQCRVDPILRRVGVKYESGLQPVGQLSGGNQQKISVGKWLTGEIDVLIIDEPTIGVDVRTKDEMYRLMEDFAAEGLAILVISSDLSEIVRISDEIVVMADLRIVDRFENDGDYERQSERTMSSIVRARTSASG